MSRARSRKKRSAAATDTAQPALRDSQEATDAVAASAATPEHDADMETAASPTGPRALFEVTAPSEPSESPVMPTPASGSTDQATPSPGSVPDAAAAADRAAGELAAGRETAAHEPPVASGLVREPLDGNDRGAAPEPSHEEPQPPESHTLSPPDSAATAAAFPEVHPKKQSTGRRKMAARELVETDAPARGPALPAQAPGGRVDVPDSAPRAQTAESGGATRARDVGAALRSHLMIIVGTAVAVTLAAWAAVAMQPSRYRAETIVAIAPTGTASEAHEIYRGVEVLQYRTVVATIAALASTAIDPASVPGPGAAADYRIRAVVLPHTDLLRLEVEGPDARRATTIANQLPALLSRRTEAMYKFYGITPISPATVPTEPFSPRVGRAVAAGLLAGLVLGAALAYAIHRFRSAAA